MYESNCFCLFFFVKRYQIASFILCHLCRFVVVATVAATVAATVIATVAAVDVEVVHVVDSDPQFIV